MQWILIALGGALGALSRYSIYEISVKSLPLNFPYATLLVNTIGSLLIGFLIVYLSNSLNIAQSLRSLLIIGFCGSFTTFSGFSLDNVHLIHTQQYLVFSLNILTNVVLCIITVMLGMYLASKI